MKVKKLLSIRWEMFFIVIFLVWKDIKMMGTVTIMTKRRIQRRFRIDLGI